MEKIKFTLSQDQLRKLSNSKTIDAMKEDIENLRLQIDKHIMANNENVKVGEIFIRCQANFVMFWISITEAFIRLGASTTSRTKWSNLTILWPVYLMH